VTKEDDQKARIAAATLSRPAQAHDAQLDAALDALPAGGVLHHKIDGHLFTFIATNQDGLHSGRRRYCVVCSTCEKLAHEATTGPVENARRHVRENNAP
jgi:hypothetical protein